MDQFPLTRNGKIDRKILMQQAPSALAQVNELRLKHERIDFRSIILKLLDKLRGDAIAHIK